MKTLLVQLTLADRLLEPSFKAKGKLRERLEPSQTRTWR